MRLLISILLVKKESLMKRFLRIASCLLAAMLLGSTLTACGGSGSVTETTAADTAPATTSTDPVETPAPPPESEPTTDPVETEPEQPAYEPPAEATLGLANVAVGCPVITNACEAGSNQKLTDGDLATSYSTGFVRDAERRTYPYEVIVDLTHSYPISGLVLHRVQGPSDGNKEAMLHAFSVEISEDGFDYRAVATEANATVSDKGIEVALEANARFVRLISTDLGERTDYGLHIAELEVLSAITTRDNLLPNKRALAMRPGAVDVLTATYRLPEKDGADRPALQFFSTFPKIVAVDETTGAVTALADGEATIYVTDGTNATPIPVTVRTEEPAYRVATFYLANHGENTREVFALLKESGITFIENCRPFDAYGNDTTEYLRVMAVDFGLTLSIADPAHSRFLSMTDEEIRAVAAKYKNLPGYGGLYLVDEPLNPNAYARVYRAIKAEDPFCLPHLNLFPPFGQIPNYHGYVTDWIATAGGDVLGTLSYDNYPYGPTENTFHEWVYDSLNEIRRSALLYDNLNTGYYIHSMGIHGAYRVPTDAEILYHTALGVAYGMKDFKHFVWFTPPYSGSGEHFITGILSPDMQKSEIYEGVKAANAMLHTLSPILANTDSVELYRYRGRGQTEIPSDFCVDITGRNPAVVSVLVDRDTDRQYLVVVNSFFRRDVEMDLTVRDAALTEFVEVSTGERCILPVKNGKLTVNIPAGSLVVFELPEGYDARMDQTVNDGTEQSLLSGLAPSVSSSASGGTFAYMLSDGNKTTTGWATGATDPTAWIVYDLKSAKTFNRVDIYPLEGSYGFFPRALTVAVSDDGKTYKTVASVQAINLNTWGSLTFETVTARYIRVTVDEMTDAGKPTACIGEIEVYMDQGGIAAMPAFKHGDEALDPTRLYLAPNDAGVVAQAYDAVMTDGDMKVNGNAATWLDQQNNTVDAGSNIRFYGWIGFSQAIASFGYVIDEGDPVWGESFATFTDDAVRGAGGEYASRFEITADVSGLSGAHTLIFLVRLQDGSLVLLHKPLTVNCP